MIVCSDHSARLLYRKHRGSLFIDSRVTGTRRTRIRWLIQFDWLRKKGGKLSSIHGWQWAKQLHMVGRYRLVFPTTRARIHRTSDIFFSLPLEGRAFSRGGTSSWKFSTDQTNPEYPDRLISLFLAFTLGTRPSPSSEKKTWQYQTARAWKKWIFNTILHFYGFDCRAPLSTAGLGRNRRESLQKNIRPSDNKSRLRPLD